MKMIRISAALCCSLFALEVSAALKLDTSQPSFLIDKNQAYGSESALFLEDNRVPSALTKLAGVHFIVNKSGQSFSETTKENDFSDITGDNCKRYGYTVTSCPSGLFNKSCPYNDKIYDKCCDAAYTHLSSTCSAPRTLSSDVCGGKHRCYCDTSAFPYASCNSPQIKGEACSDDNGTRYKTCACPADNKGQYGCQEFYAAPCGSVCKTAYADNCRNRTSVQTPYGCETYFSDCSSKCQKAYADNCRNRNHNDYGYGCQQYYSDCQSKCEIALTRPSCRIGDIFYADNTCVAPENHNRNKKALGIVIYLNPNGIGGQIMAAENYGGTMNWASSCKDVPTLPNKLTVDLAITDFDSCGNTDKLVAYGSASQFPAAWKAREYAPTADTKGKWCLPAAGVLYSANTNYSKISKALSILNGVYIHSSSMDRAYYWTSTQGERNKGTYRAAGPVGWATPDPRYIYSASKGFSCGAYNLGYLKPVMEF